MKEQEKNQQNITNNQENVAQSKAKSKVPLIIGIIGMVVIIAIIAMVSINKQSKDVSYVSAMGFPDELDGNYIQKEKNIYFEFNNNDGTVALYTIENGKIKEKSTGDYYYNLDDDGKIDITWDDDSGEEALMMKKYSEKSFTAKTDNGDDEEYTLEFLKVESGTKTAKKITAMKAAYEKEKNAKEKAEAEAKAPKEFTVGAGNYTCGEDFNAGTYDISLASGSGNVISDGENSVNEIFGSDESNDEISSYSNAKFDDGDTLEVSGSVRIKLTPKK